MNYIGKTLGQIISEARQAKGFRTQKELAYRAKVDPVYICNVEKDRLLPSIEVGNRIASILGLDARELIFLILRTKYPYLSHIFNTQTPQTDPA